MRRAEGVRALSSQRMAFRVHAIQRMFERRITTHDVRRVLMTGEVIEDYPDDKPYPSRLILGWCAGRPLHMVAADNPADQGIIVITVYEPSPTRWEEGFRRRKP